MPPLLPSFQSEASGLALPTTTRVEDSVMGGIAFLVFFSNAMFPPLLPALAREFGTSPTGLKWLVPAFSLVYAIATLTYGVISDRIGRTPVLKNLLFCASIALCILSFARTANQLVGLRALSAVATGGIVTLSLSIVGDRYSYPVQGRPMGRLFAAIAVGMGLGVSLGPILAAVIGWRNTIRCVAAGFVLAAFWIHRCYATHPIWQSHGLTISCTFREYIAVFLNPRGLRAVSFIFANGFFHGGIFAWLGVFLASRFNLNSTGIGLVLSGYGLPDLLLGRMIGGWADRYGRRYVIPAGFLWAAVAGGFLALAMPPFLTAMVIAGLSIGFGATHPLMSSITTSLDPAHRGQLTGMTGFANFTGMAVGSLAFHGLMSIGFADSFAFFACIQAMVGAISIICFRKELPVLGRA